jgi:hypothetical protein
MSLMLPPLQVRVVVTVWEVLFVVWGSGEEVVIVAVFWVVVCEQVPEEDWTVKVRVKVMVCPEVMVPRVHWTSEPTREQEAPEAEV